MPVLDINKITLHKTIIGLSCPACNGELLPAGKRNRIPFWRRYFGKPVVLLFFYCVECRTEYQLRGQKP